MKSSARRSSVPAKRPACSKHPPVRVGIMPSASMAATAASRRSWLILPSLVSTWYDGAGITTRRPAKRAMSVFLSSLTVNSPFLEHPMR